MGFIGPTLGRRGSAIASPPCRREASLPFHNHRVNEEMFFVVAVPVKFASVRTPTHPYRRHHRLSCRRKGPAPKSSIRDRELRYLGVSTRLSPDIAEYPDSGKFGVLAEFPPDQNGKPQKFSFLGRENLSVNYWDGE
jgi:hypothetical protein